MSTQINQRRCSTPQPHHYLSANQLHSLMLMTRMGVSPVTSIVTAPVRINVVNMMMLTLEIVARTPTSQ